MFNFLSNDGWYIILRSLLTTWQPLKKSIPSLKFSDSLVTSILRLFPYFGLQLVWAQPKLINLRYWNLDMLYMLACWVYVCSCFFVCRSDWFYNQLQWAIFNTTTSQQAKVYWFNIGKPIWVLVIGPIYIRYTYTLIHFIRTNFLLI